MRLEMKTKKAEKRELLPEELGGLKQNIYSRFINQPEALTKTKWEIEEYEEFQSWVLEEIGIIPENEIINEKRTQKYFTDKNENALFERIEHAVRKYFETAYKEHVKIRAERKNAME